MVAPPNVETLGATHHAPAQNTGAHHRGCQAYLNPQHLHPLFLDARGSAATSLQRQAALLMLILNNVKYATIHRSAPCQSQSNWGHEEKAPWSEEAMGRGERKGNCSWEMQRLGWTLRRMKLPLTKSMLALPQRTPKSQCNGNSGAALFKGVALRPWSCTGWCQQCLKPGHQGQVPSARQNGHLLQRPSPDQPQSYPAHRCGEIVSCEGGRRVLHDRVVHCKKRVKGKDGKWRWKNPYLCEHCAPQGSCEPEGLAGQKWHADHRQGLAVS